MTWPTVSQVCWRRYGWDALDRLVSCETPEGDMWFYRYDPFGRRLTKVRKLRERELAWTAQKFGSLVPMDERDKTKIWTWPEPPNGARTEDRRSPVVGTYFTWDGDVVAEEAPLRLDGTVDRDVATSWHFEPGGFRPLAKLTPSGALLHIVNDQLGTPREMFGEGGNLRWMATYATWGRVRKARVPTECASDNGHAIYPRRDTRGKTAPKITQVDAACDCPIRFQGQWADAESSLNYNYQRHYDPAQANYVSSDPVGLKGGSRLFGYVTNPNKLIDPLGLSSGLIRNVNPFDLSPTHSISGGQSSRVVRNIFENMKKNGFGDEPLDVIVINGKKYVVDGHHRLAAAKRAGINVDINVKNPNDVFSPGGYQNEEDVVNSAASAGPNRLRP